MIKRFKHKGLQSFFETGSRSGIRPDHAPRLARQLRQLNDASSPQEMNMPGWRLHPLAGDLAGHWSVTVNGNWRMTFVFEGEDAVLVDYRDYH
ncbi:type II toxin-antitoxin system RelE/ParE family toxin [Magnetovirga frankeli]|jgi:proteic killer suppression protein|uniref:type II toxin-antitoxin system RelE/ParE family toxin n=1 Tax=Magnetovirga frankeli TaxID=947516 RepID=UPI001293F5DE|nr:type II toxin-antitoxin system RelE/ParE family toxin [gamma proteobacterium SS-5]